VAEKLQLEWSPRQIAGWLKYQYPDDETYQVSHQTIYLTLFIQARGALKKELYQDTGKAIYCAAATTARSPHSLSATRAT
jgi:IS30 family transposase